MIPAVGAGARDPGEGRPSSHAVQGDGGDLATVKVACALVLDFGLDAATSKQLLSAWNQTNAFPPWQESGLVAKLASVARSGAHPVGTAVRPLANDDAEGPKREPMGLASRWRSFSVAELKEAPPEKRFIWEDRIPASDAGVLVGAGAGGKTSLLVGLAIHQAIGKPYLDKPVQQGSTVILSTEDGLEDHWRKIAAWRECIYDLDLEAVAKHVHLVDLWRIPSRLIESSYGEYRPSNQVEELAALITGRAPDADLLVLEAVSRLGGDENNAAMSVMIVAGEQLAAATGVRCSGPQSRISWKARPCAGALLNLW